ncbi:MAG: Hsp20 family protein [Acidobacteria bacterium]|nr:Hsp20 family protein [Acidobacteriota bacterium]MBI3421471.1 Hsp20 family protein [Acidobacteriota bacterium]
MQTSQAVAKQPEPLAAAKPKAVTAAESKPLFVEAEQLFEQMKELTQNIAKRAYDFFEARGREFGRELDDWFRAEAEMARRVPVEIKEESGKLIVRAEVPGFKAEEIKVSVEPQRLVISGKTTTQEEKQEAQTVYSEWRANQFCRALTLPGEVDPASAAATIKEGVLELTLTKIATPAPVQVAVKTA